MIVFIISCLVVLPAGMASMDYNENAVCTIVGNTGIYPTTGNECHRPDLGKYLCIEINVNFQTHDGTEVKNQRILAHSRNGAGGPCTMTECYVPSSEWDRNIWDLKNLKIGDGIDCMYKEENPSDVILKTTYTYNQALTSIFIPLLFAVWFFVSGCGLWMCDCWCCYHFKLNPKTRRMNI